MHAHHDVLESFASYQRMRGLSERTIRRRAWSLANLTASLTCPILEATAVDVESWLGGFPGAQSRCNFLGDVRALFRWACRRGLAAHDPADQLELPKLPHRMPRPIATADVHRLIDSTSGQVRRAVMLAAYAGLRVSEVAKVEGRDVEGGRLLVVGGKGDRDRWIPLAPELAAELAGLGPGSIVGARHGDHVSQMIRTAMRRIGIAGRPHDLRHSFGTAAAEATGGNLVIVAELMGHASMATTRGYVRMVANVGAVANLYPRAVATAS